MTEEQVKDNKQFHEQLQAEYTFDMDNPPKVIHKWVDRGMILSCEGAAHPNHRHYKQG